MIEIIRITVEFHLHITISLKICFTFNSLYGYHLHFKQPKADYMILEPDTSGSSVVYCHKGDGYHNTSSGGHFAQKACCTPDSKKEPKYYNTHFK